MTNVSAAESANRQATQRRSGRRICHQYCQARSATCWPTRTLAHTYRLWRTGGKAVGNMSEEPKISMAWYLFGRAAPKNAECVACRYGPVLQILQNGFGRGPFLGSDCSFVRASQRAFRAIVQDYFAAFCPRFSSTLRCLPLFHPSAPIIVLLALIKT
jgi:hypothetical protein